MTISRAALVGVSPPEEEEFLLIMQGIREAAARPLDSLPPVNALVVPPGESVRRRININMGKPGDGVPAGRR